MKKFATTKEVHEHKTKDGCSHTGAPPPKKFGGRLLRAKVNLAAVEQGPDGIALQKRLTAKANMAVLAGDTEFTFEHKNFVVKFPDGGEIAEVWEIEGAACYPGVKCAARLVHASSRAPAAPLILAMRVHGQVSAQQTRKLACTLRVPGQVAAQQTLKLVCTFRTAVGESTATL